MRFKTYLDLQTHLAGLTYRRKVLFAVQDTSKNALRLANPLEVNGGCLISVCSASNFMEASVYVLRELNPKLIPVNFKPLPSDFAEDYSQRNSIPALPSSAHPSLSRASVSQSPSIASR